MNDQAPCTPSYELEFTREVLAAKLKSLRRCADRSTAKAAEAATAMADAIDSTEALEHAKAHLNFRRDAALNAADISHLLRQRMDATSDALNAADTVLGNAKRQASKAFEARMRAKKEAVTATAIMQANGFNEPPLAEESSDRYSERQAAINAYNCANEELWFRDECYSEAYAEVQAASDVVKAAVDAHDKATREVFDARCAATKVYSKYKKAASIVAELKQSIETSPETSKALRRSNRRRRTPEQAAEQSTVRKHVNAVNARKAAFRQRQADRERTWAFVMNTFNYTR